MSCKSALSKLSSTQLQHCLNLGLVMSSFKSPSSQAIYQYNKGKLVGYLECLVDMGTITQLESRVLLIYFSDYSYENNRENVG